MVDNPAINARYDMRGDDDAHTANALAMKQGRLLFLRALKENYKEQEESGRLRWTAAALLCHIADELDDSISTSSQVQWRPCAAASCYGAICLHTLTFPC
jgi:hypothetical protein